MLLKTISENLRYTLNYRVFSEGITANGEPSGFCSIVTAPSKTIAQALAWQLLANENCITKLYLASPHFVSIAYAYFIVGDDLVRLSPEQENDLITTLKRNDML